MLNFHAVTGLSYQYSLICALPALQSNAGFETWIILIKCSL